MTAEERAAWDVYFVEVAGWTFHPGYYRENATMPTLDECADVATRMIKIRRERFNVD